MDYEKKILYFGKVKEHVNEKIFYICFDQD